eukprot:767717-Hanusia_phi.AAC.1
MSVRVRRRLTQHGHRAAKLRCTCWVGEIQNQVDSPDGTKRRGGGGGGGGGGELFSVQGEVWIELKTKTGESVLGYNNKTTRVQVNVLSMASLVFALAMWSDSAVEGVC